MNGVRPCKSKVYTYLKATNYTANGINKYKKNLAGVWAGTDASRRSKLFFLPLTHNNVTSNVISH